MLKLAKIRLTKIPLEPHAYQREVDKYGVNGLKELWIDILERYGHEEYYNPDLVEEILRNKEAK